MNVAVVAQTQEQAVEVAARLGMTRTSTPLAYGISPLLGHRFTACLSVGDAPLHDTEHDDWWIELIGRVDGPIYRLET